MRHKGPDDFTQLSMIVRILNLDNFEKALHPLGFQNSQIKIGIIFFSIFEIPPPSDSFLRRIPREYT